MNILFIGTTDILGGAAKISWELKKACEDKGYKTSMFVADKRSNDPKVKIIPRQKWRKYLGFLLATDDLLYSDWILKTSEYKNAYVVHFHNIHGRFFNLSTLQKISTEKPIIWTLHDEWAITPHCVCTLEGTKMKNGLYVCPSKNTPPRILWDNTFYLSWRKNNLYKKLKAHIITPSLWLKNRVEKTILRKQDIRHIPNGIDTSIFKKTDKNIARNKLGLPLDKKIILFLADDAKKNIWKGWKYTEEVINHYKNNNEILFISVGNHTKYPDDSNVKYFPHIEKKEDLALYYSASDILLFTSIAENFPLVILEAMSCGLPIVSFDVGGVKEVLSHKENGYISTYKDTESLINGMEYILKLPHQDLTQISQLSANKIRDKFSLSSMIEQYLNLYSEVLKDNIELEEKEKQNITDIIIKREKLRHLNRLKRLTHEPIRTIVYYFFAALSHIKPYKMSFKTLWGSNMTSYLPEGNTFYYYGYCEANITNFLLKSIKSGEIVLDIGAHVGFYSMLLSKLVGQNGQVHSFEPTKWTYKLLNENTNKLSNVTLNNLAVSDKQSKIKLKDYGLGYGAYNTIRESGSTLKKRMSETEIDTISIDKYCSQNNLEPSFVKLDAEGYEYAILNGMSSILENTRPLITLEVAGGIEWQDNCKKSIDYLINKKYKPYEINVEGNILPHKIQENYTYDNLLFIPEEKINKIQHDNN